MKRHRWDVIYDRIKDIKNPVGAEIGVHRGECSGNLLKLHPGLKLYMIDMWSPDTYKNKGDDAATEPFRKIYQDEADDNFKTCLGISNKYFNRSIVNRNTSIIASSFFLNNELDFCFIDASHSYEDVKADRIVWLPKIKPGGYLFLHDYGLFEGVTKAVDEMFAEIETDDDYMAVVKL